MSEISYRPTRAEIDLKALEHNYRVIREKIGDRALILAMVKADAYGHGAAQISQTLEKCGVRALGVATVEEGAGLREDGISSQILVMGGLMGAGEPASKKMLEAGLTPVIHSVSVLDALEADAAAAEKKIAVHLKVDTGMSRLGLRPEALQTFLSRFVKCRHLFLEGVMTHLADADDIEFSDRQMELFEESRTLIEKEAGPVRIWHIANSGAVFRGEPVCMASAAENWVRPGLALYGDLGGAEVVGGPARHASLQGEAGGLKPVMKLVSRIALIKNVPAGTLVSYGGTYVTKRPSTLAIVPMGYADGYPWSVSGRAFVLARGLKVPVAGRVTMDMIVVDVTDCADAAVQDEVVLMGRQNNEEITAREIAKWAGTITYEIFCGISKRMPRVYKR